MIKEQDIRKLIDEQLEGTDKFLVELKVKAGNNILVFIDGDHDVQLQDCINLSKHIESNLDRDAEDFSLNVSSHGLDQPLRFFRQYPKNVGRILNIVLEDGSRKRGELLKAEKEGLTIRPVQDKKKKKTDKEITEDYIRFDQVRETRVVATFKKQ